MTTLTSLPAVARGALRLAPGLLLVLAACGPTNSSDAGVEGGVTMDSSTPVDAGGGEGGTGGEGGAGEGGTTPTGPARVRVAHLSPGAPAVDFCVKPRSAASFSGTPTLAGLSNAAGLAFGQVTAYLELAPGEYDVRIVAPGSMNCDTPLAMLPTVMLPAITAGSVTTVAATGTLGGTGETAFGLRPVSDSLAAPMGSNFRIRFVHFAPGAPAVDVGLLVPGAMAGAFDFSPLFSNVAFGATSMPLETAVPAGGSVPVAVRAAGTTPATPADYPLFANLSGVTAGGIYTAFAVGQLDSDQFPLNALVCQDNGAPVAGLSRCQQVPARVHVRVAHLAPDAPAVDVCLGVTRPGMTGPQFVGPLLKARGVTTGLPFGLATRYLNLSQDLFPQPYTLRIVAPNAADCSTALAGLADTAVPMLAPGAWATVAASGQLMATPSTFGLRPFVDTHPPPPAGKIRLRFVHLAPTAPNVDVGVAAGEMFTAVWSNVAFPTVGMPMGADANGFVTVDPLADVTLQVRPNGMSTPVLTLSGVSVPAGGVRSIFAIGVPGGTGAQRLSALVCDDRAPASMNLAPCVRLPAM